MTYRKIWEQANGPIPADEQGRPYEIHHVDGNKNNNDLSNLQCVTIREHYEIHKRQGDYGAAWMIAQRLDLTEEEKAVIYQARIGIKHSTETKAKISEAMKGKKHSPETRAKLKGRIVSVEARAKRSEAMKGQKRAPYKKSSKPRKPRAAETKPRKPRAVETKPRPPKSVEHRAKLSQAHKGKKPTPEHAAKISHAKKGKKQSPQHIAKRQATIKLNKEKKKLLDQK